MRLAIVVGHNAQSQGAVRPDTGETEYRFNSELADLIEEEASLHFPSIRLRVFFREPSSHYRAEIEQVYNRVDRWRATASIELHFNSHVSPSASGSEVLSSGSRRSMELAREVQQQLLRVLGLKDRGVKIVTKGRGGYSLIAGRAPAILIEPFFGSSVVGQAATDEPHERRKLARAILCGALAAFG
jgi:N-acetylmuramoyl-L-alanine amidase